MATTLASVEEYLNTSYEDGDREYVDGTVVERNLGEVDHADLQSGLVVYLRTHYQRVLWAGTAVRVQVRATRFRVPDVVAVLGSKPEGRIITAPPFLVAEIISRDDRVDELEEKIEDYVAFGISHVWVLNPRHRRAWVYTSGDRREVSDVLRTSEPAIEVPLAEIFA